MSFWIGEGPSNFIGVRKIASLQRAMIGLALVITTRIV